MSEKVVKIVWQAFAEYGRPVASAEVSFNFADSLDDLAICEVLFRDTNTYSGDFWSALEPALPATRSHTALSIGDKVSLDGKTYLCQPIGWSLVA